MEINCQIWTKINGEMKPDVWRFPRNYFKGTSGIIILEKNDLSNQNIEDWLNLVLEFRDNIKTDLADLIGIFVIKNISNDFDREKPLNKILNEYKKKLNCEIYSIDANLDSNKTNLSEIILNFELFIKSISKKIKIFNKDGFDKIVIKLVILGNNRNKIENFRKIILQNEPNPLLKEVGYTLDTKKYVFDI